MIVAFRPAPQSSRELPHDRADRAAAPQESAAADTTPGLAAESAQPHVAWVHAGRGGGTLCPAALRRLPRILLSGARGLSGLPFGGSCLRGCAAARHAPFRNDGAGAERCLFPRTRAVADRP